MAIDVSEHKSSLGFHILEVDGEFDVFNAPTVRDRIVKLLEQNILHLIIDMQKVNYIDSTGLGVLIGALKKLRERSGKLALVCGEPKILKVFQITGLDRVFQISKTIQEAERLML